MNRPKVSLGVPVYNGQRYLEYALRSLVDQTFADFELIICDNASTDRTAEICREFASRDSRIRYYRNERNIGANPNFNRTLELASGEYFKWAAYDDICQPTYLEHCVAALDADPEVSVAHTRTAIIDDDGKRIDTDPAALANRNQSLRDIQDPPRKLDSECAVTRFSDILLKTKWCFEIFGLYRTEQLRLTGGMGDFYGTDKVLLATTAVQGKFVEINEELFLRRNHAGQSSQIKSAKQRAAWSGAAKPSGFLSSQRKCVAGYHRALRVGKLGFGQRLACHAVIARYLLQVSKWPAALGLPRRKDLASTSAAPVPNHDAVVSESH
ncbi:glycosyltransferase family 2 protein [soil metagenome]